MQHLRTPLVCVADKGLAQYLNALDATLTKNTGYILQAKYFSLSSPRTCRCPPPPIFRTLFQVPYSASPLLAALTKTPGVWGYSSHSGTRPAQLLAGACEPGWASL